MPCQGLSLSAPGWAGGLCEAVLLLGFLFAEPCSPHMGAGDRLPCPPGTPGTQTTATPRSLVRVGASRPFWGRRWGGGRCHLRELLRQRTHMSFLP